LLTLADKNEKQHFYICFSRKNKKNLSIYFSQKKKNLDIYSKVNQTEKQLFEEKNRKTIEKMKPSNN
jgi:hypothetical protein